MNKNYPKIDRVHGEYNNECDYVYIEFDGCVVRVTIPPGHDVDDVDIDISFGNGWE